MRFVKAQFDDAMFDGAVYYEFFDDETDTDVLVHDFVGDAASWEELEGIWNIPEELAGYRAYPELGASFIFRPDDDVEPDDDVIEVLLRNVQFWEPW